MQTKVLDCDIFGNIIVYHGFERYITDFQESVHPGLCHTTALMAEQTTVVRVRVATTQQTQQRAVPVTKASLRRRSAQVTPTTVQATQLCVLASTVAPMASALCRRTVSWSVCAHQVTMYNILKYLKNVANFNYYY